MVTAPGMGDSESNDTNGALLTLPAAKPFDGIAASRANENARKSLNPNLLPRLAEHEEIDFWNPEKRDWDRVGYRKSVPGWLIPFAVGAIALAVASLGLYFRQAPAPETTALQPPNLANIWRERCEDTVRRFLEAESVEEKLQWVRHPEQTRPRFLNFIARGEAEPWRLKSFRSKTTATRVGDADFLLIDVQLAHGVTRTAALELTPSGAKLDWESFVLYEETPWQEFVADRPGRAATFRVHCATDDYYNFGYSDAETHQCLRIDSPDRTGQIYAYVLRDSGAGRAIQHLLDRSVESGNEWTKLTLKLRFGPNAGRQQVEVEELASEFWVFDPKDTVDRL